MKIRHIGSLVALLGTAWAANAQSMKPGLWEMSNKMQSGSGQMEKAMAEAQKQMASLPPEQRKMMEEMMAKQGVNMAAGAGGSTTIKVCMTQQMIDRNEVAPPAQGDCKSTMAPRVGNTMKVSFTCTKPPSSGEGLITFTSAEAFTMQMAVNTAVAGKTEKMTMDSGGKWLGTDCGSVKPLAPPKP